jgi:transcription elongation GreA/GreB family factor
MSRAFVKEDVDVPEAPTRRRGVPVPELNVVTPAGLAAARAELEALGRDGRDHDRIRELTEHLQTAQALEPEDTNVVGLGARVTVELEEGGRATYHIVGAIEADAKRGAINWQSPLAQALWGRRVGDGVTLPKGEAEIVELQY